MNRELASSAAMVSYHPALAMMWLLLQYCPGVENPVAAVVAAAVVAAGEPWQLDDGSRTQHYCYY